jgi:hypothetical protein
MEKDIPCKWKTVWRAALTSDKIHFKSKAVQREQFEKFKKT